MSEDISDLIDNGPQQPVAAPQAATDAAQPQMAAAPPQAPIAAPVDLAPHVGQAEMETHVNALIDAGASEASVNAYLTSHGYLPSPDIQRAIAYRANHGSTHFPTSVLNGKDAEAPKTAEIADLIAAPAGSAVAPAAKSSSSLNAFGLGMLKPADNLTTGIMHTAVGRAVDDVGTSLGFPSAKDAVANNNASRLAQGNTGGFETAGNIAALALIPGAAEGTAGMALSGMAGGALLSDADSTGQVVGDMAKGALGNVVGGKAMQGIGGAIAPQLGRISKYLDANGVPLTLGQILGEGGGFVGRLAKNAEDIANKTLPIAGQAIDEARQRTMAGFNRYVGNRVIAPLGETIPQDTPAGADVYNVAKAAFDKHYGDTLSKMQVIPDGDLFRDLGSAADRAALASPLPPGQVGGAEAKIHSIYDNVVRPLIDPETKIINGQNFKAADSNLRQLVSDYESNPNTANLSGAVNDMRLALRSAAKRSSPPGLGDHLDTIDNAYHDFTVLRNASARAKATGGVYTPNQLLQSISAEDGSVGKGGVAGNLSAIQKLATDAQEVLPSKIGDSGTTARSVGIGAAGSLLTGLATGNPALVAAGAVPLGAGALGAIPYSRVGQKAVQSIFTPGATRQFIGRGVKHIPLGYIGTGLTVGGGSGAH